MAKGFPNYSLRKYISKKILERTKQGGYEDEPHTKWCEYRVRLFRQSCQEETKSLERGDQNWSFRQQIKIQ